MDLKEFTKQTLVQIVEGVKEANEFFEGSGAQVMNESPAKPKQYVYDTHGDAINVVEVDFDVAITATESEGANGGAGLRVASIINFGGGTESKIENQTISRIKFTLPLVLNK